MSVALLAAAPALSYEPDPDFGGDGVVTTNGPGGLADTITDIEVLSDGKILATGRSSSASTARDFALYKYNADGSPDTAFGGGDGIVTTDIGGNGSAEGAFALAVQTNGKIVVAGFHFPFPEASNDEDTAVVRYNADGTLDDDSDDAGFGGDGIVTVPVSATYGDSGEDVVVDGSGRVVVAGYVYPADVDDDFSVIRLSSAGALDTTFDGPSTTGNGIVTLDFTGADGTDYAQAVDLLDDGDIIAGGRAADGDSDPDGFALARLNHADGTLDTGFDGGLPGDPGNGNGMLTTTYCGDLRDLAITPGKILGVGSGAVGFCLARYNQADGTFDTSGFNADGDGDGLITTPFFGTSGNASANSVVIDGSNYVVSGDVSVGDNDEVVGSARYLSNGALDVTYGGDGFVSTNRQPAAGSEDGAAVGVVDDGNPLTENKVVVGGRTVPGDDFTAADAALYRYRPDVTDPQSAITKPGHRKTYRGNNIRTFMGTAADAGSGIEEVEVALRRRKTNGSCAWFDGAAFVGGDCGAQSFIHAVGRSNWSYEAYKAPSDLKSSVGTKVKNYTLYSRSSDLDGHEESVFETGRNQNTFDVR